VTEQCDPRGSVFPFDGCCGTCCDGRAISTSTSELDRGTPIPKRRRLRAARAWALSHPGRHQISVARFASEEPQLLTRKGVPKIGLSSDLEESRQMSCVVESGSGKISKRNGCPDGCPIEIQVWPTQPGFFVLRPPQPLAGPTYNLCSSRQDRTRGSSRPLPPPARQGAHLINSSTINISDSGRRAPAGSSASIPLVPLVCGTNRYCLEARSATPGLNNLTIHGRTFHAPACGGLGVIGTVLLGAPRTTPNVELFVSPRAHGSSAVMKAHGIYLPLSNIS
jgi:hypothetical protein